MARPRQEGFDYFSFDVGFFWDKKIKGLKGRFGISGVAVYIYLLAQVYGDKGYYTKADVDLYDSIIADLGVTQEFTEQVVKFLSERSMLEGTLLRLDNVITAVGIQRRFQAMSRERGKRNMIEVDPKIWLLGEDETAPFIKFAQNQNCSGKNDSYSVKNPSFTPAKPHKVKESKVKKSKVKDSMPPERQKRTHGTYKNVYLSDQDMEKLKAEFPADWQDRIDRLSEYMESTGKTYKNHLATIRSWARRDNGKSAQPKKSKFNNYDDTNRTDYADLENKLLDMMLEDGGETG